MAGRLPWESVAHAALAVVAHARGDQETATAEARAALDIDGESFIEAYIDVLWAAGRVLVAGGEPEAAALTAEILGGFAFLSMSIGDPEMKARWFDVAPRRELADIVGFDPTQSWETPDLEGVDLGDDELDALRGMAAGSVDPNDDATDAGQRDAARTLLAKLGVESPSEAIEFAIKAGITWQ